jgi:hypothetical protein
MCFFSPAWTFGHILMVAAALWLRNWWSRTMRPDEAVVARRDAVVVIQVELG